MFLVSLVLELFVMLVVVVSVPGGTGVSVVVFFMVVVVVSVPGGTSVSAVGYGGGCS